MHTLELHTRFERQIILSDMGIESQLKLTQSKVLIIGMGGLGCPAAQYLVAAGIGTIGLMDGDVIDISNLHRQILYTNVDIGKSKVEIAAQKLRAIHEHTSIHMYPNFISKENGKNIIAQYDIVLDCTDRFDARYIINDFCIELNKPIIFGAVFHHQGQIAVFNHGEIRTTLRDIFPIEPSETSTISCNENGILGMTPGIVGTMQALETIKYIAGLDGLLYNELLHIDLKYYSFYKVKIDTLSQEKKIALNNNIYHTPHASLLFDEDLEPSAFNDFIQANDVQIIDVRNPDEWPFITAFDTLNIPLSNLESSIDLIDKNKKIVFICHVGIRSYEAVEILAEKYHREDVYHLKGGIVKWLAEKDKL